MSEEENVNVEQEVVQPSEAAEHNDVSQEAQESEQSKRNDAEYNWAEMRRQREKDREELNALKAELNRLKPPVQEPEDDFGIKDDDLLEGRHLKDLKREIKQLKSELKQRDSSNVDKMIKIDFPDYYSVVNKENLELLEKTDPELAESLLYQPDEYKKKAAAYKLIKKTLGNQVPQNSLERKKAAENSQKPISVNAVTKNSAIGNAHLFENGLTPELKKMLQEEMRQAIRAG